MLARIKTAIALFALSLSAGVLAETTYIHTDHLGSISAESNNQGTVTARFHFKPFGESIETESPNEPGYTGHVFDAGLDLSYAEQRYYDPLIGRFYSNDPFYFDGITPGTFNRYAYVENNPYAFTDPTGEHPIGIAIALIRAAKFIKKVVTAGAKLSDTKAPANPATPKPNASPNSNATPKPNNNGPKPNNGETTPQSGNPNQSIANQAPKKQSKVNKETRTDEIGGKFGRKVKIEPGRGPGQSRSEMTIIRNADGKVIRTHKDSFDRAGKFQHRKHLRGGPEGRSP